ncbi:MAG: hypothetical protein PHG19_03975 [Anaerotignum sp.]|nr:hypothetical protein [Anaerotignum sp.]
MANISFNGLSGYITSLERMARESGEITKKALYEGVNVTANEVRTAIEALPTDEKWGTPEKPAKGIKEGQKQALLDGFGVSRFREADEMIAALAGFSGYSTYKTAKYPEGQPLAIIARVAESGTSFSKKTPFMAKAVRRAKPQAEAKMKEIFENEIENIMRE